MNRIDCHIGRFLAPVEPGNLLLLSYKDDVPVVSAPGWTGLTSRSVVRSHLAAYASALQSYRMGTGIARPRRPVRPEWGRPFACCGLSGRPVSWKCWWRSRIRRVHGLLVLSVPNPVQTSYYDDETHHRQTRRGPDPRGSRQWSRRLCSVPGQQTGAPSRSRN